MRWFRTTQLLAEQECANRTIASGFVSEAVKGIPALSEQRLGFSQSVKRNAIVYLRDSGAAIMPRPKRVRPGQDLPQGVVTRGKNCEPS